MSVGAGSIKRAAKAAEGNVETRETTAETSAGARAAKPVKAGASETGKTDAGAKAAKEDAEPKASKAAKKKTETPKPVKENGKAAAAEKTAVEKPETGPASYATYGIGQELPVYLM